MDSQSKEAQGQGVKKLAKQHLTKKQGVEGGQALRRAQHLTNPSEEKRTVRDANTVNSLTIIIDNRTTCTPNDREFPRWRGAPRRERARDETRRAGAAARTAGWQRTLLPI